MFGNFSEGSQNTVWRLELEGKIPENYENRSKICDIGLALKCSSFLFV